MMTEEDNDQQVPTGPRAISRDHGSSWNSQKPSKDWWRSGHSACGHSLLGQGLFLNPFSSSGSKVKQGCDKSQGVGMALADPSGLS